MNERQQAHIDYFFERIEYWRRLKRDEATARMLAARDADHAHPLRSEEEGSEVFDYLRQLEQEQSAEESRPHLTREALKRGRDGETTTL